jgi:hypothetical protein
MRSAARWARLALELARRGGIVDRLRAGAALDLLLFGLVLLELFCLVPVDQAGL